MYICPALVHIFCIALVLTGHHPAAPRSSTAALSLESVGSIGSGDDGAEGWAMACCANTKPPGGAANDGMGMSAEGCSGYQ